VNSSNRLSSVLVPPQNLSVLKLPRDVSFLTGTKLDCMNVYYIVVKVQAYSTAGFIRLVVRIPLRGVDRVMTLCQVESLTTYSDSTRGKIFYCNRKPAILCIVRGNTHKAL
jgi:hypothetical protein